MFDTFLVHAFWARNQIKSNRDVGLEGTSDMEVLKGERIDGGDGI